MVLIKHLPECPMSTKDTICRCLPCICDALRACEARVREDERSSNFTPDDHSNGMTEAYQRGLDAIRDAVAGCAWDRGVSSEFDATVSAVLAKTLAAIDALREQSHD